MLKLCHELWKNYSMIMVNFLQTIVMSFCMKSLIQVFLSGYIAEPILQLGYDENNQLVMNNPKHYRNENTKIVIFEGWQNFDSPEPRVNR